MRDFSNPQINLLIGPPGTGKTTSLIKQVEGALARGIEPNRIAVLTFTKAAATEVIERSCEKFNLSPRSFPYFRTLHSLAFKTLGLNRQQVMTTPHFKEIGKFLGGFDFRYNYDENVETPPMHGGLGDKCLSLYGMAKAMRKNFDETWRNFAEPDVSFQDFSLFARTLEKYKEQKFMFDFTDFMDKAQVIIPVDVFILDEAQDLTPQQWNFAKRVSQNAQELWIAGDDDQAIFQWAGADVEQFLSLKGRHTVLPVSYRLPRKIWSLANSISGRISHRFDKDWSPRDEEGRVEYIHELYECDLDKGSWMILARHQYQLAGLEEQVRQLGYPYFLQNQSSLDAGYIKAILHYEAMRSGVPKTHNTLLKIAKFIGGFEPKTYDGEKTYDQIQWPWDDKRNWMEAFDKLGFEQKEYVRALKRRGVKLTEEPRIRINTIHSTKGGEADNVVLLPDLSRRTYIQMMNDPDPELRVWYVAVSRARQALFIMDPRTERYFLF